MFKIIFVKFFKSNLGNEPVKVGSDIQTVEFGFPIGMPLVKKIDTKYKIWEVRSKLTNDKIARVLFTIYKDCMILLHGFIKKDQKLPQKDKNIAIQRSKKLETGECGEK